MIYHASIKEVAMTIDKSRSIKYIGIDPGKSGGIAVICDKYIEVKKCPETVHDMALLFSLTLQETPPSQTLVMIEKVWARPHDGRASVFTFAGNYGQWQGIVASHEIKPHYVTPQVWMKAIGCPKNLKKQDRKNHLKALAKKKYPKLAKKMTLATADAMLIADYAKNIFDNTK